jgi:hypothetical protein
MQMFRVRRLAPQYVLLWLDFSAGLGAVGTSVLQFHNAFPNPNTVLLVGELFVGIGLAACGSILFTILAIEYLIWREGRPR